MAPDITQSETVAAGEPLVLNLWPDVGRLLGLSRSSVYAAASNGDIPTVRIGKRLLVPKRALVKMLEGAGERDGE